MPMTVAELIAQLQSMNQDAHVVLSSDEEGNHFSLAFNGVTDGQVYLPSEDYRGEVSLGYAELTEELEENGYTEEDILTDGTPCVVLWATR